MRPRLSAVLLGSVLLAAGACGQEDSSRSTPSPASSNVDAFTLASIADVGTVRAITLWRVGEHASGPGREPAEPIASTAARNDSGWAFSVEGTGRADSSFLGVPADAAPEDAQAALLSVVEAAGGRAIEAEWTVIDADTWTATTTEGERR